MIWNNPALPFVTFIFNGIATGSLARHRGRSFYPWFFLGTLGWFIAIPWMVLTKSRLTNRAPPAGAAPVSLLAAACSVGLFVAIHTLAAATLPHCDYYTNISALNSFLSGSAAAHAGDLSIITINNIKEVSRSDNEIRCTGTARLSNSAAASIDYRVFVEDGKLSGEVHW
jgi:hypothetical protein